MVRYYKVAWLLMDNSAQIRTLIALKVRPGWLLHEKLINVSAVRAEHNYECI